MFPVTPTTALVLCPTVSSLVAHKTNVLGVLPCEAIQQKNAPGSLATGRAPFLDATA